MCHSAAIRQTTFEAWMKRVDGMLERRLGLSSLDLPDVCYRDMFDHGHTPAQAAAYAVQYMMGEE